MSDFEEDFVLVEKEDVERSESSSPRPSADVEHDAAGETRPESDQEVFVPPEEYVHAADLVSFLSLHLSSPPPASTCALR